MSIRFRVTRAAHAARTAFSLRRFETIARGGRTPQPLCIVYGNCQAEPIRALLASCADFTDRFEPVRVPAVHEVTAEQVPKLRRVLSAAALVVAQPIKPDYRGMPLGVDQIAADLPRGCQIIRFPALLYDALYPFQITVAKDGGWVTTPLTLTHDLRTLCAAARGLTGGDAVRWVRNYRPPEHALLAAAEQASARLRQRESGTDIRIVDWITASPRRHARSFFTLNHPARSVLGHVTDTVLAGLGFGMPSTADGPEPLGLFRTPLEQPVIDALALDAEPARDWVIKGRQVSTSDVIGLHARWYQEHPDVVRAGLSEHAARIKSFGLLD